MTILDILNRKGRLVVTARPTETLLATVRTLTEKRIGAVIVEDEHLRPGGIFTERDFAKAVAKHGEAALSMPIGKLMSAPIITCRPSDRIDSAMALMTRAKIRHLPVMENGELLGIVSIGDLVQQRLHEKELEAGVLLDLSRMRA
ncbi:MAG: CBS domain-containing protein [Proteobacteria bacterium]|nr:CBS domain-containing protein [Pseudomonadota bacterium]